MSAPTGPSGFRKESIALLALAFPVIVNRVGMALMLVVDSVVAGLSGTLTLAGVAVGTSAYFLPFIAAMGMLLGIEPIISAGAGSGDAEQRRSALVAGRWLAVVLSLPVVLFCLFAAPALSALGQPDDVVHASSQYLLGAAPGSVFGLLFLVNSSYLSSVGLTRPLLKVTIVMNLVNAALDVFFILGPTDLGALGVGLATSGCNFAGWLATDLLRRKPQYSELGAPWTRPNMQMMRRVVRIGWPVGVQFGLEAASFALVTFLIAARGAYFVAGHQIAYNVSATTFTAALGVSIAAGARVGTAVGRKSVAAVRLAGRTAFTIGFAYAVVAALVIIAARPLLIAMYSATGAVSYHASRFLFVAALFQLADVTQAIGFGVLRGLEDTRMPVLFNLIGYWGVGLPIGIIWTYWLGDDPIALWWGLCIALCGIATLLFLRFRKLVDRMERMEHAERGEARAADVLRAE